MSRRVPLLALALAALVAALPAAAEAFDEGVANGDVTSHSALVWTRADGTGLVRLEVAKNKRFSRPVIRTRLRARKSADNTVQTKVRGLAASTRYFYRFTRGKQRSAVGTFKTAPKTSANRTIRFAWTGDADATPRPGQSKPFWNSGQVYARMAKERNDFNINIGDTIYSDSEVPGITQNAKTVAQKWEKYRLMMDLRNVQRLREAAALYSHWDDHEFMNDFSPAESSFSASNGEVVNIPGRTLYQAGKTAFRDYQPVTYSSRLGIYRSFRWGRNLEIFLLDERSFRSAKASANHTCDNPQTGQPDLAPTAPPDKRALFAAVIPSLSAPVSPACLAAINDPNRTMLGARQLAKFESAIKASKATFKVVMTEMEAKQYYANPYDRWEGYEAERQKLLTFLRDNIKNVVLLATDVHATLAVDARLKTFEQGGPQDSGILEVSTGPAATKNFAGEIDDTTGGNNAQLLHDVFLKPAPPSGIGMQCANLDTFSYGEVTVTSKKLTISPRDSRGRALKDGSSPCGPFTLTKK
jgi:alkaline phosphatase D